MEGPFETVELNPKAMGSELGGLGLALQIPQALNAVIPVHVFWVKDDERHPLARSLSALFLPATKCIPAKPLSPPKKT